MWPEIWDTIGPLFDQVLTTGEGVYQEDSLLLVNTLLDFSRIEAGRVQAHYQPTDLSAFTEDLSSAFRSLVEKAGLTLAVDCSPLPEPIYVDREMYEKVVLNLLSNAFKFTFQGGIRVSLEAHEGQVRLIVEDSGTGTPEAELPRLFERFHRVEGAKGRSYEGSGIGLALVQELVRLHGGNVSVESRVGQGSRFTASFPRGRAHLLPDGIEAASTLESTGLGVAPFLDEASQWLADGSAAAWPAAPNALKALGGRNVLGKPLLDALPEHRGMPYAEMLASVYRTGEPVSGKEMPVKLDRTGSGTFEDSFWSFTYLPVRTASGDIAGVMTFDIEVTEEVVARQQAEALTDALKLADQRKTSSLPCSLTSSGTPSLPSAWRFPCWNEWTGTRSRRPSTERRPVDRCAISCAW